ncbi:hypothetical protein L596_008651 [Steinernema carpocapsae]|uniref:C3H1-type domain-containing protein n=1 Tax=Steinernema carpocapsae TaxID=34508 RepID=A0A4U5PDA0_STECR|nr:hypothetical protein L596_008651 [Steinernema carpocapsae]
MEATSRGTHPPLRRINAKAPSPTTFDAASAHPLLFSTSSNQSYSSSDSVETSASTGSGAPSPPERGVLEAHDSCYSSCSEESHASLSRETSDSLARLSLSEEDVSPKEAPVEQFLDEHLVEFATKLGYSEIQLRQVLQKFGSGVGQDRILNELIKMGKQPPSVTAEAGILSQPNAAVPPQPMLRPIVIDGSNIAMTHGRKEVFSCRGIRESVNFFRTRGHTEIIVFVPQFRREAARSDCPITDQHILFELEAEHHLVFTPSRKINGRRIVCHDDRYILKTADEKEAVIVSNDEYRDLIKEHPHYRRLVEERLLMYSFVDGKFMPPDDPLGRYGPKLDAFLCKGRQQFSTQLCPYARKCTYGNKCKYFHPERPNGIRLSATDRLLKEKNNRQRTTLSSRPSMVYENSVVGHFPSYQDPSQQPLNMPNLHHGTVGRTQSLNVAGSFYGGSGVENQRFEADSIFSQPPPPNHFHQMHPHVSARLALWTSTPPPPPQMHANQHNLLNRHMSAPLASQDAHLGQPSFGHQPALQQEIHSSRSNSVSDFNSALFSQGSQPSSHMYTPSTSVWGESEFSFGLIQGLSLPESRPAPQQTDDKLRYHLSQLFPESAVAAVMNAHPDETDPQKLCQRILALQQGFQNSSSPSSSSD